MIFDLELFKLQIVQVECLSIVLIFFCINSIVIVFVFIFIYCLVVSFFFFCINLNDVGFFFVKYVYEIYFYIFCLYVEIYVYNIIYKVLNNELINYEIKM